MNRRQDAATIAVILTISILVLLIMPTAHLALPQTINEPNVTRSSKNNSHPDLHQLRGKSSCGLRFCRDA
ncbi:hypothetical protein FHS85_003327 [Rhodoligotrophos appendicifer]